MKAQLDSTASSRPEVELRSNPGPDRRLSPRHSFLLLACIMVGICTITMAIMTLMLYRYQVRKTGEQLQTTAKSQARLIESVARYDARMTGLIRDENPDYDSTVATLSQIADAYRTPEEFGDTTELLLARRDQDNIIFLLMHGIDEKPASIPFDSDLAQPMQLALDGRSGTLIGLDYHGEVVVAAHEPVDVLNLGVVVKIDLAEIRAPFIRATSLAGALATICILFGTLLFSRISSSVIARLEKSVQEQTIEIEQRKAAEQALQKSQARYRRLAENSPAVVFQFKMAPDGAFTFPYISRQIESVMGLTPEEVMSDSSTLLGMMHPEDALTFRDGVVESATNLTPYHREIRAIREDQMQWLESKATPEAQLDGSIIWDGFFSDISDKKRAEDQRRQAEIRASHANRMESLGVLAGGIAHDFNNLLGAMTGYSELAMATVAPESKTHRYVAQVMTAVARAADMIKQILAFSRRGGGDRKAVNMVAIVDEAVSLLRSTLPSNIILRSEIQVKTSPILADATQIQQVIMNLGANAHHEMQEQGGELSLLLTTYRVDTAEAASNPHAYEGDFVHLAVRDNGNGIPPDVVDRIFEPFFTTKDVGEGSGMGLATSHGIILSHAGFITVESEIGVGTVFNIYLPASEQQPESQPTINTADELRGDEHIMVIDDELSVLDVTSSLLRESGYRVTPFSSGREALVALEQTPDAWDLILTDQTMPEVGGIDVLLAARKLRTTMPVMLMTGHSLKLSQDTDGGVGANIVLRKPFSGLELTSAIRHLLDS